MFVWLGRLPPPWQVARADKARHRVPPPADQRGARTAASLAPLAFLILLPWHRPGRSNITDLATAFVLRCATRAPCFALCSPLLLCRQKKERGARRGERRRPRRVASLQARVPRCKFLRPGPSLMFSSPSRERKRDRLGRGPLRCSVQYN